jgi:hypothetical protein
MRKSPRDSTMNRRMGEIILGLILIFIGISAAINSDGISMLIGLAGLYLIARQFDRTRQSFSPPAFQRNTLADNYEFDFDEAAAPRQSDQVYTHALDAVRKAGLDASQIQVLPTDIGVMAFRGDQDPIIYRTQPVLDDIDYIQPFVQLRLPTKAVGRIRFEITDSDGQILFVHEDVHQLQRGRNLITPSARLPIHDAQAMQSSWELRVSADGTPLAVHQFSWQESESKAIRRHLTEDGEISNEMRAMMADNRLQRLSLDDLLGDQDQNQDQGEQRQMRR